MGIATSNQTFDDEAITACNQAIEHSNDKKRFGLELLITRWEILNATQTDKPPDHIDQLTPIYESIKSLYGDKETDDKTAARQLLPQIRVGQYLLKNGSSEVVDDLFDEVDATISKLRELYRKANQPMLETHCMRGRMYRHKANRQWHG